MKEIDIYMDKDDVTEYEVIQCQLKAFESDLRPYIDRAYGVKVFARALSYYRGLRRQMNRYLAMVREKYIPQEYRTDDYVFTIVPAEKKVSITRRTCGNI